ncbi:MAG TPA: YncE family protein, partial [Candidatus Xenobia bacterium]
MTVHQVLTSCFGIRHTSSAATTSAEAAEPQDVANCGEPGETAEAAEPKKHSHHRGIKILGVATMLAAPVLGIAAQGLDVLPSPLFAETTTVTPQSSTATPQGSYAVTATYHVPGSGTFDYQTYDSSTHDLYITHGSRVEVLNTGTDQLKVLPRTADMIGVHGIALVKDQGKAFVTDGITSKVTVYDLKTDKPTGEISVGKGPDNIMYDQTSGKVFAMNSDGNSASVINPQTDQVEATIQLGGSPEEALSDGQGHLYVALNDQNQVARIDTSTLKVDGHYGVGDGDGPT